MPVRSTSQTLHHSAVTNDGIALAGDDEQDQRLAVTRSQERCNRMSRTLAFIGWLCLSLVMAGCGGGSQTTAPPPPPPPPPVLPTPTILRTLYRVVVNGTDRMTSFGPNERSVYPLEAQLYYVPDAQVAGETALNRMVNTSNTDHADAVDVLDGYSLDEELGFPWSRASLPGLSQMEEGFNSITGDNAMLLPGENLPGYVPQTIPVYGYPRYGDAGEALLTLTAGGVQVQSNAVAGGVVWRWFWNGMEFVNNADYGRQIQAAFYYPPNSGTYNPNEAGDYYSRADPTTAHGSPLLQFENQGNTQITRTVPLNWDPVAFGGDPDHPVIWSQIVLGKDLTLNFNNMGSVAKYTTHLVLPASTEGGIAAPAIYLRASFNRYWTYDAPSRALMEVTGQVPNGCPVGNEYFFHSSFGGSIISDASGNYAMGLYAVDEEHGGTANYISMGKYLCSGDGAGESAGDTVVMNAVRGGGDGIERNTVFPAGESTYNVYLISDSVQNVAARMDDLYHLGVQ
jgi:hypothetical protein